MHLLLALTLLSAPANAPGDCEKLWDDTVAAAAPDLDPSDDLRKSYLSRERAQLERKCVAAGREALACPAKASRACAKRFPQPPDGGRAFGLAACVWPEVQACVQQSHLLAQGAAVESLLAELEAGKVVAGKGGLLALPGAQRLLSARGEALVQKAGPGYWLALITRRAGSRIDAVVYRSLHATRLPQGPSLELAGLKGRVVGRLGSGVVITTAPR